MKIKYTVSELRIKYTLLQRSLSLNWYLRLVYQVKLVKYQYPVFILSDLFYFYSECIYISKGK